MCMYKIYCAKIASSSFVLQNCFRIKIIGSFRSQKSLCNGRSRRCERHQGCRPSLAGYQENFLASAEAVRDASQVWPGTRKTSQAAAAAPRPRKVSKRAAERFRGLGKHQNAPLNVSEASEGVRDAGQVLPGTRKTSLPRQRPSGTPAKSDRVPGKLPCLGRGRQGRRPSLTGYQKNFAGGRSRPAAAPQPPRGLSF